MNIITPYLKAEIYLAATEPDLRGEDPFDSVLFRMYARTAEGDKLGIAQLLYLRVIERHPESIDLVVGQMWHSLYVKEAIRETLRVEACLRSSKGMEIPL